MKLFTLSVLSLLLLSGCTYYYPRDLELKEIKVLNYRDAPELPGPPKKGSISAYDPYSEYMWKLIDSKSGKPISEADLLEYFDNYDEAKKSNKRSRLIAKVKFQSKHNLHEYARKNGSTVSREQFLCEKPQLPITYLPYVYYKGLVIAYPANYSLPIKGPYIYYTYLNLSQKASGSYSYFDLLKDPEDMCFKLRGGNMMGFGFKSNTIRISGKSILQEAKKLLPNKLLQPTPKSGVAER